MSLKNKIKMFSVSESGRSMVEMLGVLAIIGVLSIGAVAGYKFAVTKYQSIETIEEIRSRAIDISAQLENTHDLSWGKELKSAYPKTTALGYQTSAQIMNRNKEYFQITLTDIPSALCAQIMRDYESENIIFINNNRYSDNIDLCNKTNNNTLGFVFANDLTSYTQCGDKAEFNEETLSCHCSGISYINMNTNECECPKGHVWSDLFNDCIESICTDGSFESLSDGCILCSDSASYQISDDDRQKKLCQACKNASGHQIRDIITHKNGFVSCVNITENNCTSGDSFRLSNGTCMPCNTKNGYTIGTDETSEKLCTDCGRQIVEGFYNSHYCVLPTMCNKGSEFIFDNGNGTGLLQCISCNTTEPIKSRLPSGTLAQEYCEACQSNGINNRTYINSSKPTCVKNKCDSGEFLGADGNCYSCTDPTKHEVNTGSGCTDTACSRQEVTANDGKTYCQPTCQTNDGSYVEIDGNCYPCSGNIDFSATKAQCEQCTNPPRLWVGNYGNEATGGTCMEKCTVKEQAIGYSNGEYTCYTCAGYKEGFIPYGGYTDVSKTYCQECGNYLVTSSNQSGTYCVSADSCEKGREFRHRNVTNYEFCMSCDLTDPIEIGDTQGHRDMCQACTTTKRFWSGEYCYPCTTIQEPAVLTEDEEKSCLNCGNRVIENNTCILPR